MYKRFLVVTMLALMATCVAFSQAPKPVTPPVISDALKAQFFKAQSQKVQADIAAQQKAQAFSAVVAELTKTCGEGFEPQINPAGDPACVAKPEPKKK